MGYLLDTIFGTVTSMCVVALVTMAITLIFKTSFTTNFAQGVISALGAYVASTCFIKEGMSVWLAIPISMLVSATVAMAVDVGIFRRGRYVNALSKQIITMGLISIVVSVIPMIFTESKYGALNFISGNLGFTMGDYNVVITKNSLICLAITAVILTVLFVLLYKSKWGLSVRATASNEYVAGMLGINTHVVTAISWGIAGALGALAACLNSTGTAQIGVYFMTDYQVKAFLAGIVGGFATFHGPVIVAFIIPLFEALIVWFATTINAPKISGWATAIVYIVALIIIFFKPNGIFGKKIAKKV